jgi:hypothetical protein
MNSAFQIGAFQSNAFQIALRAPEIFGGGMRRRTQRRITREERRRAEEEQRRAEEELRLDFQKVVNAALFPPSQIEKPVAIQTKLEKPNSYEIELLLFSL